MNYETSNDTLPEISECIFNYVGTHTEVRLTR